MLDFLIKICSHNYKHVQAQATFSIAVFVYVIWNQNRSVRSLQSTL